MKVIKVERVDCKLEIAYIYPFLSQDSPVPNHPATLITIQPLPAPLTIELDIAGTSDRQQFLTLVKALKVAEKIVKSLPAETRVKS